MINRTRATARLLSPSLALVLLLASCGGHEAAPQGSDASTDAGSGERVGWPERVRLGLVPSEGGADIVERFAPLAAHLERELGVPVEAFSASEYIGIITAMQNDQVEIAYLGPKSYVEASRIAGAVAVALELDADGNEGYYSIIVTREGSGIGSLDDARGRSFAFVTPNSTSGFLVPAIGIMEATGQQAEDYFGDVRYTGSHATSIRAVLNGDIDVSATNTLDLDAMVVSGLDASGLVEIWRSDLIPGSPFAVRDDLPESFANAVRDAMVAFSDNKEALEDMARGGFIPITDAAYDPVRVLEQKRAEMIDGG